MDRVEETGSFPLEIRAEGDVARLTDRQLDPGTLCPGRTVTARYRVAFAEDVTRGRITLAAEAYDANLRLLARQRPPGRWSATAPAPRRRHAEADRQPRRSRPRPAERAGREESRRGRADRGRAGRGRRRRPRRTVRSRRPAVSGWCRRRSCSAGCCSSSASGLLLRLRHLLRPAGNAAAADDRGLAFERPPARRWR